MDALEARMARLRRAHDLLDLQIGHEYSIYKDDAAVARLDQQGILQMWLFDLDERKYMRKLYQCWRPRHTARILDVGCGTGRMAELLQEHHPLRHVVPLNRSWSQLQQCALPAVQGDMHALPFVGGYFTDVLLCYTLGYGLPEVVFAEISRVLIPGGTCVLLDIVSSVPDYMLCTLGYKCYTYAHIMHMVSDVGLHVAEWQAMKGVLNPAFAALADEVRMRLIRETHPIFMRLVKEDTCS